MNSNDKDNEEFKVTTTKWDENHKPSNSKLTESIIDGKKRLWFDAVDAKGQRILKVTETDTTEPDSDNVVSIKVSDGKTVKGTYTPLEEHHSFTDDEIFLNTFSEAMINDIDNFFFYIMECKKKYPVTEAISITLESEDHHKKETTTLSLGAWENYINLIRTMKDKSAESIRKAEAEAAEAKAKADQAEEEAEKAKKAQATEAKARKKAEAEIERLKAEQEEKKHSFLPTSPANNLMLDFLSLGSNIDSLTDYKTNKHISYEVLNNKDKRLIRLTTDKETITLGTNISKWERVAGTAEKKLLNYILIKINEQIYIKNNELNQDFITFPLEDLVANGMYKHVTSARRGFKEAMDNLYALRMDGTIKKRKDKNSSNIKPETELNISDKTRVLFTGKDIDRNMCIVYLNPHFNWDLCLQYFTILPNYYFRLPPKAADLLYDISYLLRINAKDIPKQGYTCISLKQIRAKLALPLKSKNPYRDIIEPINKAVEEIIKEGQEEDIIIEKSYDQYNSSVSQLLEKGYLKIIPKGDYALPFTKIAKKKQTLINNAVARKQKIEDTARAKNLEKKIKKEEGEL